jgi:uncharacterized protein (DUF362 family)
MTRIFTQAENKIRPLILEQLRAECGHLRPRSIVLKPNWVIHETDPAFPIRALVTDPRVIEATLEACLEIFPSAESILVGDCPLQSAEWALLCRQSGFDRVMDRFTKEGSGRVEFRDLRKDVYARQAGSFLETSAAPHGDPKGYAEVSVGKRSHLEPISGQADKFAVNDYSASVTASNHAAGEHRYFVCRSVLEADLLINLPKWKSHQKTGITAALKNLVGVNADKAYLPHFRRGAPAWGGDEYRDEKRWLYWLQTNLRERVQKRSRLTYSLLKPGWEVLKKMFRIETRGLDTRNTSKQFYVAGGAWQGNDTLWRTIYDLNLIIQCADRAGQLQETSQRAYFCIVDGLVSGEGNGPLEAVPKETNWLIFGDDPFAIDITLAHCMGYDIERMPLLTCRGRYAGPDWGRFAGRDLEATIDGSPARVLDTVVNFHFAPPPGWRDCLEREPLGASPEPQVKTAVQPG